MNGKPWMVPALALLLGACGGDAADTEMAGADSAQVEEGMAPTPTTEDQMGAMATAVAMTALGGGTATGEAILTPSGSGTEVNVTLNGLEANSTHPGHIHQGTCDSVGSVVAPLSEITADASGTGSMTTTVELGADSLFAGNYIVVYHDPGGTPMVCGQVEEHVM
ncbi:MAG TPA: hypothetical protein VF167_11590 [Longimicrobiaceae bacterium]